MKKNIFFMAVIALVVLMVTSCNNNKKTVEVTKKQFPELYYAGNDITTSDTAAVFNKKTVQWTVCGTDKKVKGIIYRPAGDTVFSHTVTAQGLAVPADSLAAWAGNTTVITDCDDSYGGKNLSSNGSGFWDILLNWILPILLGLILLILLIRGISWLVNKDWPEKNSSSKNKTGMTNSSARSQENIDYLTAFIAKLKGQDGTGSGKVKSKDGCNEEFEVVVDKPQPSVTILNTGKGSIYMGNVTNIKCNNSNGEPPVVVFGLKKAETKKEEPVAPVSSTPAL